MLSAAYSDYISNVPFTKDYFKVSPKVITLSGFYCANKRHIKHCIIIRMKESDGGGKTF